MIEKSDMDSRGNIEDFMQDRLDTILSEMTACSNKSALQYKKLSDGCFFWTALVLHIVLVACAMTITDLDIVIEFAGAVGASSNMFLFPGLAYILALRKFGKPEYRKKWSTCFYTFLAWFFLALYFTILAAFFFLEINKALGNLP